MIFSIRVNIRYKIDYSQKLGYLVRGKCQRKNQICLPVYTGQKVYRTLVLGQDEEGFWLKYENKKADGTHAKLSLYGGYAEAVTLPYWLNFTPDVYNCQLLGTDKPELVAGFEQRRYYPELYGRR